MRKYYGQFEPSVDRFLFERYFNDESIRGVFVECGAFDGLTECSCKFFEETLGWKGYNFEPVPWIYEQLCSNRPASRNLNFALSNAIGESVFRAVVHPHFGKNCTNGSLQHTPTHSEMLEADGCTIIDVAVRLRTWRDFVEAEGVTHVDLFVLDVEGHELAVLEGMKDCPILPDLMCVEIGHLSFDAVRTSLHQLGYRYDISSHVNAFFIRNDCVPLFALRSAAAHAGTLALQNQALEQQVALAHGQLKQITSSRALRAVEMYRRLLRRKHG